MYHAKLGNIFLAQRYMVTECTPREGGGVRYMLTIKAECTPREGGGGGGGVRYMLTIKAECTLREGGGGTLHVNNKGGVYPQGGGGGTLHGNNKGHTILLQVHRGKCSRYLRYTWQVSGLIVT